MTLIACEVEDCIHYLFGMCRADRIVLSKYEGDYQIHYCQEHTRKD